MDPPYQGGALPLSYGSEKNSHRDGRSKAQHQNDGGEDVLERELHAWRETDRRRFPQISDFCLPSVRRRSRASGNAYWARVGHETRLGRNFVGNLLISLALPRGLEPLFSP